MDLDNIIVPDDISVQSNEERIVIDPITRVINIPEDYIIGVESDEKSDRMYFQCPKIVGDNVDLSKLRLYVNFENANKERDNYFVDDVTVNEGNILFSWLFSRKVTKYKGDVKFIVCAKKSEDNLTLEWNTTVAKGLSLEGIEVELSDEEQSIASDYLIQLEKELSALAETENNRLLITSSNQITNITNKGSEQVQLVENTAKKALDSIPSTYTDLQKQVNEVEDRELKDANGITQELTITDGYAQLTDTATKRLNSLVIKGNSEQEGSTATSYEPYTGGKPSPSPEYPQEIKAVSELSGVMSGKNLLKPYGSYPKIGYGITLNLMNDGIHVNGKCTGSSWHTFIYSDTLQAGTYYINGIKGASNSRYQVVLYKNSAILNYITTNNFKLELKEKAKIELSLFVYSEYGTFNDLVLPYMICRNENDLYLYTPYQGQSLLNYTLQNPLYKIGDVYDYIDFNRGKIIRNVGVVTFDGSDDELWNKYSNNVSMDGYSVNVSNAIDTTPCICNKLLTTDAISTTLEEAIKVLDNAMYVVLNKIRGLNTTELFKSWLQSNPITVCYQLATPTEKDIPQELLTQLKQLQTLQQMNVPNININNIPSNPTPSNFDFNGKWVDGEEQARNVANNNLPLILFDNNNPVFYMKNMDGAFKKFKFEEIKEEKVENTNNERMDMLEAKMDTILKALQGEPQQVQQNVPGEQKPPQNARKGGKTNG